jgi:hypothetical protein
VTDHVVEAGSWEINVPTSTSLNGKSNPTTTKPLGIQYENPWVSGILNPIMGLDSVKTLAIFPFSIYCFRSIKRILVVAVVSSSP